MRSGASLAVLYAVRLAARVAEYAAYALSPAAAGVRGAAAPPRGAPVLEKAAAALRGTLEAEALPVLHSWYARLRRAGRNADAATVAQHLAFAAGAIADGAGGSLTPQTAFALLSGRVFVNVHHDFSVEPEAALEGSRRQRCRPRRRRRRRRRPTPSASTRRRLRALDRAVAADAAVALVARGRAGSADGGRREDAAGEPHAPLGGRPWRQLGGRGLGGEGRYIPLRAGDSADAADAPPPAIAAPADGDDAGAFETWLRRACEVSETEVNVQLGELTLNQNQMSLLESAVARHPDFVAVFGEGEARYSCAEVERREHRRWVRVLGADFDVQIWSADPSVQPFTVKRKGGGDAAWALKVWDQLRGQTAALAAAGKAELLEGSAGHALLRCTVEGADKTKTALEVALRREPPAAHVYALVEHGRRWYRSLAYTTDRGAALALPADADVAVTPRPHWTAGAVPGPPPPTASLVIVRTGGNDRHTFVPARLARGVLPDALLEKYTLWRREDGTLYGEPSGDVKTERLEVSTAAGGGATVRRVPLDRDGEPVAAEGRLLISAAFAPPGTALAALAASLERLDDLAHVLLWSAAGAAEAEETQVAMVELPRLRLSFDVRPTARRSGRMSTRATRRPPRCRRASPRCSPGCRTRSTCATRRAARPCCCRRSPSRAASRRRASRWPRSYCSPATRPAGPRRSPASATTCTRSTAPAPTSRRRRSPRASTSYCCGGSTATGPPPPSSPPAARRTPTCRRRRRSCGRWWESSTTTASPPPTRSASASRSPPAAARSSSRRGRSPSSSASTLRSYPTSPPRAPSPLPTSSSCCGRTSGSCRRSRRAPPSSPPPSGPRRRSGTRARTRRAPPRPQKHAPMAESGHAALLGPAAAAAWKGRLEKIQYQRPEDQQFGEVAAATVGGWLPNLKFDAEKSGFWLLYELLVGGLAVKVLAEDDTHELGALLARMSSTGGANELLPLLRALEMEPGLCSALPSFSGEKKKGVIGLFKKGMNAKGMSEQLLGALQKELPKLPRPPPRAAPNPYVPPTQLALPPMRQLRTAYRAWTAPGALGVGCDKRPMPAPYAADGSTSLARRRLSREGPSGRLQQGARAQARGSPGGAVGGGGQDAQASEGRRAVARSKGRRRRRAADAQGRREGRGGVSAGGGARRGARRRCGSARTRAACPARRGQRRRRRGVRGVPPRAPSRWRRGARRRWGCPTSRRC